MNLGVLGVGKLAGALHVLSDVEGASACMVAPPVDERLVVSGLVAYFPVDLWQVVVHPSFFYPQHHIGIEVVIVLEPVGVASVGVVALVAVDSEGRHAKFHPGLHGQDGFVELLDEDVHVLLDQLVHILPTPVAAVHAFAIERV